MYYIKFTFQQITCYFVIYVNLPGDKSNFICASLSGFQQSEAAPIITGA